MSSSENLMESLCIVAKQPLVRQLAVTKIVETLYYPKAIMN